MQYTVTHPLLSAPCLPDILTRRKSTGKLGGQIWADRVIATDTILKKYASYMPQETSFLPLQTAKEAIIFQMTMRMGR